MTTMYFKHNLDPEHILVYLRKSRSDDPLLTTEEVLEKHEMELDDWCMRYLGTTIPQQNKFKEVISGETMSERTEFKKVLKKIETPLYNAIMVVEASRLSRGDLEEIGRLLKILRYTQTLIITPQKIYDVSDEFDREALERELKRGNEYLEYSKKLMKRGKLIACKTGQWIFTFRPFGYNKTKIKDGRKFLKTLEIREDEAEVVRMIFDWYVNKDMSMNGIADNLNKLGYKPMKKERFAKETIAEILENPVYIGKIRYMYRRTEITVENQEIIKSRPRKKPDEMLLFDGLHEAIISEELFMKAKAKKSLNVPLRKGTHLINPLAGIFYCKRCGKAMKMRAENGKNKARFECSDMKYCQGGSIVYDELMERIVFVLKECIEDFEIKLSDDNLSAIEEHELLIANLEKKLVKLDEQEIAQWQSQTNPDESMRMPQHIFKQLNEKLLKEKAETKRALKELYESVPEKISYEEKLVSFQLALQYLLDNEVDVDTKNKYLKDIIEKITFDREKGFILTKEKAKEMGIPYAHRLCRYNPPFHLDITLRD